MRRRGLYKQYEVDASVAILRNCVCIVEVNIDDHDRKEGGGGRFLKIFLLLFEQSSRGSLGRHLLLS